MNPVMASVNTIVRKMTEMSQPKKNQVGVTRLGIEPHVPVLVARSKTTVPLNRSTLQVKMGRWDLQKNVLRSRNHFFFALLLKQRFLCISMKRSFGAV